MYDTRLELNKLQVFMRAVILFGCALFALWMGLRLINQAHILSGTFFAVSFLMAFWGVVILLRITMDRTPLVLDGTSLRFRDIALLRGQMRLVRVAYADLAVIRHWPFLIDAGWIEFKMHGRKTQSVFLNASSIAGGRNRIIKALLDDLRKNGFDVVQQPDNPNIWMVKSRESRT